MEHATASAPVERDARTGSKARAAIGAVPAVTHGVGGALERADGADDRETSAPKVTQGRRYWGRPQTATSNMHAPGQSQHVGWQANAIKRRARSVWLLLPVRERR